VPPNDNRILQLLTLRRSILGIFSVFLFLLTPGSARAQLTTDPAQSVGRNPSILSDVHFDQKLGERIPLDLNFVDEHGQEVLLRDFFGHGPVILILAYYRCPMLCTQVLNGAVRTLRQLNFELGKDYQVVVGSIDPTDSPALASTKHEEYSVMFGRPEAEKGWHFLTGREPEIKQLADGVGFHYAYDPASRQFAHASGIIILTEQGIISQYSYGVSFPERTLRLGLVRASRGQIGSFVDQVLLYCYHYDPQTGKYGIFISRVLKIGGALTVLALGVALSILFRKESYEVQA
jgi:protein SCO1